MLKRIKNKAFGRFIHSKPYTDKHNRITIPWNEIKTMGFLLDGSDPISLRLLLNRLNGYEKEGKKVEFLGYVKKLPPFEDDNIKWLTKKNLTWIGIPKMKDIKYFIEKKFDVLINTSLKSMRPLEFVSTYSKANLRIGAYEEKKIFSYDFMMHVNRGASVDKYLDQVEHYLKMVKSEK